MTKLIVSKTRDIITHESAERGDFDTDHPDHGFVFEDKEYSPDELALLIDNDFGSLWEPLRHTQGDASLTVYYPEFTQWDNDLSSEAREVYHVSGDANLINALVNLLKHFRPERN
jgi:hypothetical protein